MCSAENSNTLFWSTNSTLAYKYVCAFFHNNNLYAQLYLKMIDIEIISNPCIGLFRLQDNSAYNTALSACDRSGHGRSKYSLIQREHDR